MLRLRPLGRQPIAVKARSWEYAFLATGAIAAALFGAVNDLLSSRVSWEYFFYGKDLRATLGPSIPPDSIALAVGAAKVGASSWWVGVLVALALFVGAQARSASPFDRHRFAELAKCIPWLAATAAGGAALGAVAGRFHLLPLTHALKEVEASGLLRPDRFRTAYGWHLGAYVGAAVGTVITLAFGAPRAGSEESPSVAPSAQSQGLEGRTFGRHHRWRVGAYGGLATLLMGGAAMLTQPLLGHPAPRDCGRVDPSELREVVEALAHSSPRNATHPDNLKAVASQLAARFRMMGTRPELTPFQVSGNTYWNVSADFGPPGGEVIVVGAHYDAHGEGPAADDNASGVAALMALGRLFQAHAPAMRVELVAYSLEESQFGTREMGSAIHAAALRQKRVAVRAMLSLEMLGTYYDAPGSQHFPTPLLRPLYPSAGNFIAVVGRPSEMGLVRRFKRNMRQREGLQVEALTAPRQFPGVSLSDHASYWDQGFPAIMVTDTAFYRNPRYHTEADAPDTLDYVRMARVVEGLHCAVEDLAAPIEKDH